MSLSAASQPVLKSGHKLRVDQEYRRSRLHEARVSKCVIKKLKANSLQDADNIVDGQDKGRDQQSIVEEEQSGKMSKARCHINVPPASRVGEFSVELRRAGDTSTPQNPRTL
ncbi:uncharacterized protein DMAD_01601 [Drosophila madeirensis]|uniref:Uncharacterized protein n=1 Tax=Drosophila madeirensis TaxID=30013 RepID=A0AAU9G316_DROMD